MSDALRLVVLDSVPLNPGDLDWTPLHRLGEAVLYDNTAPAQVAERIRDADVVFSNKVPVRAESLSTASRLKLISVLATGYDIVDVEAAQQAGVTVCNVPAYSSDFTAQSTIALLLELTNHAGAHAAAVREGQWSQTPYFSFWNHPLIELAGKTLVIVGLGTIGRRVAAIATAMGMKVVATQIAGRVAAQDEYPRLPLDEALAIADVISLHCPLTPDTRGLINAERLKRMKPGVLLINTSRGLLVDEAALAAALQEERIAGYAGDVLSQEPPAEDNPLLHAPGCLITPHISWAARETRQRLLDVSVENLRAFLKGKPQNVVSKK
jgi:glycerate dehydrogenase